MSTTHYHTRRLQTAIDAEMQQLQERYEQAMEENTELTRQLQAQPISAAKAQELHSKREEVCSLPVGLCVSTILQLREEAKEKKQRLEQLVPRQIEISKEVTRANVEVSFELLLSLLLILHTNYRKRKCSASYAT